jgi:lipid II:glycine glycyltransferase (peptidoglycan interpeptide bridge formation enzyme)
VPFGDTVIYKKGGWMGTHKDLHPNELLHWEAILWAKRQGYHYYDFEGIYPDAAAAIQKEGTLPQKYFGTVTWFKSGFGGDLKVYPEPFDYFYNPIFRWAHFHIFPKINNRPEVISILSRYTRT